MEFAGFFTPMLGQKGHKVAAQRSNRSSQQGEAAATDGGGEIVGSAHAKPSSNPGFKL